MASASDGDPGMVPSYAKLKNSVRISYLEDQRKNRDLKYIVEQVLLGVFGLRKHEILSIQDYPKRGVYDVTFTEGGIYKDFVIQMKKVSGDARLSGIRIVEHFPDELMLLVIKMYSPYVKEDEIVVFLRNFCKKIINRGKVMNECGIWSSKWKFLVEFKEDLLLPGRKVMPPARFKLGNVNGDVFFPGMPNFCRACRRYGHDKNVCESTCTNCGSTEHSSRECTKEKKCSLCYRVDHLYASCPHRNKEKQQRSQPDPRHMNREDSKPEENPTDQHGESATSDEDGYEKPSSMKVRRKEKKAWQTGAPLSQQRGSNLDEAVSKPQSAPLRKPENVGAKRRKTGTGREEAFVEEEGGVGMPSGVPAPSPSETGNSSMVPDTVEVVVPDQLPGVAPTGHPGEEMDTGQGDGDGTTPVPAKRNPLLSPLPEDLQEEFSSYRNVASLTKHHTRNMKKTGSMAPQCGQGPTHLNLEELLYFLRSIPEKEILDTINSFNLDVFNTKILPQSWKMVNFNKCEILKVGKLDTRDIKVPVVEKVKILEGLILELHPQLPSVPGFPTP
ncbi:uncharacterized protein LOC130350512 [Hyla sarda]|uniref:uncharacterized protein LOC130299685 n=1 Tax=Hyla sarda TaxID=327740 RepID=UPI0024C317BD|nr:uncharacterized protein LOC130299685 [Hyla sarda]XP_056407768.1 uncharacterized protein LOC130303381 [Hyla sarda]XP_056408080.1 uncharacterized protein LOC130306509 [Hyla sarda]XP_056408431.1 uncharacterized protein LOC130311037 [Hyla sarda]XP_056408432.1 uncharacterized protein LOC130311038 [Hyla sarda]XP_056408639.1 uncharacterized protein LOC130313529 [Hyla sarda]XP_056408640.1 uncharacterized protein LOC130313530 [Hyla sarda]XP_056408725.1 uncharacterized protein LOC130315071 [Hyla sa